MNYSCLILKGQERIICNVKDESQVSKLMRNIFGWDGRYVGLLLLCIVVASSCYRGGGIVVVVVVAGFIICIIQSDCVFG